MDAEEIGVLPLLLLNIEYKVCNVISKISSCFEFFIFRSCVQNVFLMALTCVAHIRSGRGNLNVR